MKRSVPYNQKSFNGVGYLIGYLVALVFSLIVYYYSKTFIIAIATYVPIGTTLGILFEQRLHKKQDHLSQKNKMVFMTLFFLGVAVFISLFLLVNL